MQTPPTVMQPSRDEIQREVENLRDIKRRSTLQGGPGVLVLDPDLPTPAAQAAAAQQSYWAPSDDSSSDSHSHEDSLGSDSADASDDPFHLFWVPANMHPEIDPAQFRAFLKEHARAPGEVGLGRSESLGAAALGRKRSMLSRQYRPSENDGVEDERVVPLRRNRSSLYASAGPQLTIKDLEKLDELAEEASQSRDPSKLRSVLRRSLSMNMSPSVIDNLDNVMPDPGEDADAPIIVPRPGQILRRAARTKIRKPGQTGEGAHRFNATRRGTSAKRDPTPVPDPRSSSDLSTSDHSDAESPLRLRVLSNDSLDGAPRLVRPESYSAEAFIFDAYARDEGNEDEIKILSPPSKLQSLPRRSLSPPPTPPPVEEPEPVPSVIAVPSAQPAAALPPLVHPLPQRASSLVTPAPVESPPSRTPSPVQSDLASSHTRPEPRPIQTPPSLSSTPPVPQGPELRREKEKDKDKKGLFKWGGSEKKGKKEQREKEKDAGFFGSLFGSKKKQEESATPAGLGHGQSGRDAAVALLGASKSSRGYVPPASPQSPGVNNYSRYPIHVERAIYRLSHIKLANPRRALYEQVLISNLMFWYLGVINKTQQPQQQQQQQQAAARQVNAEQAPTVAGGVSAPASTKDREEGEHTATDKEHETQPVLAAPQAQAQGQAVQPQPSQNRRGSLTKAVPSNAATRRAEQPVRGPQYDMQHRAMEQEYGAAFPGGVGARQASGPPAGAGYAAGPVPMQMSMSMSMSVAGPGGKQTAFPSSSTTDNGPPTEQIHTPRSVSPSRRSRSPPPPLSSHLPSPLASHSSPPPIRYVPPQQDQAPVLAPGDARPPARSMSATVTPPVPAHAFGGARVPGRKALSAHAVLPPGARRPRTSDGAVSRAGVAPGGEEEDVPLALWQQARRR
ncbi:hypothetical protein EDB89DRAFT_2024427 [Lactarius sanguifluus]|nr:hypothetical protein EDB89DRAFT_2024427 [Lactarius sanguifluus]